MNTSLVYQILLYLNSFYFGMLAVCEFGMALLKYLKLPYPQNAVWSEILLLIFLCFLEAGRIYLGRKGNLSERGLPFVVSILLIFPAATAVLYFLLWQAYVLRLEVILCSIQLVLHGSELIFAFLCFIPYSKSNMY